jgi:hypothetical protein
MVWAPPKGQRATIQKRFAALARDFQHANFERAIFAERAAKSAELVPRTLPVTPAAAELAKNTDSGRQKRNTCPTDTPPKKLKSWKPKAKFSVHHIPPRRAGRFILKHVNKRHHVAYHMLFGNSGSLQECIEILRQHWWPDAHSEGEHG